MKTEEELALTQHQCECSKLMALCTASEQHALLTNLVCTLLKVNLWC